MALTVLETLDEVRAAVGRDLGTTEWSELTAEQTSHFADATGDGGDGVAAQPLLLLALTNLFLPQIVEVRGVSLGVNYGTGEVRFPAPVVAGSRIRGQASLTACEEVRGGVQTTMRIVVEVEGHDEPACVVDALSRWLL